MFFLNFVAQHKLPKKVHIYIGIMVLDSRNERCRLFRTSFAQILGNTNLAVSI
jgi:hypothetical protein